MRLEEWVAKKVKAEVTTRSRVVKKLAADSGVSKVTLDYVLRGALMQKYDLARRVSEATGGEVSIQELCE